MYTIPDKNSYSVDDCILPFGSKINANNRWVKKIQAIPWDFLGKKYSILFTKMKDTPAKPFRMVLGALFIKTFYGTMGNNAGNPYLKYFLGLKELQTKQPFDSTTVVYFIKRLTPEIMAEFNEIIISSDKKDAPDDKVNNNLDRQQGKDKQSLDEKEGKFSKNKKGE